MLLASLILAAATVASPSARAEQLGIELARSGVLATLIPLMSAADTERLVAAHPELSPAELAQAGLDRALEAEGHAYAAALSEADLAALVALYRNPAVTRQRTAQPAVIAATMAGLQGIDFKRDTLAAFCVRTGKACAAPE